MPRGEGEHPTAFSDKFRSKKKQQQDKETTSVCTLILLEEVRNDFPFPVRSRVIVFFLPFSVFFSPSLRVFGFFFTMGKKTDF